MTKNVGLNPWRGRVIPIERIHWAIDNTTSMAEAAKALRVTYNTFKKYAKMYDLWKPNPGGKGSRTARLNKIGRAKLNDIFDNKYPMLPHRDILEKLLKSGLKAQECETCGYDRYRPSDLTSPLMLHMKDGDPHNHEFKNLELICYNCFYIKYAIKPPKNTPIINLNRRAHKPLITAFDKNLREK